MTVDVHMKNGMASPEVNGTHHARRYARASALAGALLLGATAFAAGPNADQATRMYNRIAGTPPTAAQLAQMTAASHPVTAALIATQGPAFYNNTIRNLAAPGTTPHTSTFVPLTHS